MPKNPYPGRKNKEMIGYYETKIMFKDVFNNPKLNAIEKSPNQRDIDDEKVQSMIDEYLAYPHFLRFKNRIIIGILNNKWYLVDGQHRLEMAKKGYSEYNLDDEFIFCWYSCTNENDMRELFNSVNKDSIGNEFYVNQDNLSQIKIDEFCELLKSNFNQYFSRKKNDSIYTIPELRDSLITIQYFENYSSGQECLDNLIQMNDKFYDGNRYQVGLDNGDIDTYYKCDQQKIQDNFIISLKNCNFIQWLKNPSLEEPYHQRKKEKNRIEPRKREALWRREYGNQQCHECPISFCNEIMIHGKKNGWHAGHIISERHKGTTELNNLKPICAGCNQSMGSKDWKDYDPSSL
tara:strand:- start:187 stop:1230 length:1044 start_codon:yes stop_codon:yes gene_type:complete